jgi:hypothetical protein
VERCVEEIPTELRDVRASSILSLPVGDDADKTHLRHEPAEEICWFAATQPHRESRYVRRYQANHLLPQLFEGRLDEGEDRTLVAPFCEPKMTPMGQRAEIRYLTVEEGALRELGF